MPNSGDLINEMRLMAVTLIVIQLIGIIMLFVGLVAVLRFCKKDDCTHDRDSLVIIGALGVVIIGSLISFGYFGINEVFRLKELTGGAQWHHFENQLHGFLWSLAWLDSVVLFLVVLCTGGLAKSFYSPVYLLIPSVTLLVQEPERVQFNQTRTLFIASLIFISASAVWNWLDWHRVLKEKWSLNPTTEHREGVYVVCLCGVTVLSAVLAFADFFVKHYYGNAEEELRRQCERLLNSG